MVGRERLGVVGAGRMAKALVKGWLATGKFLPEQVLASDIAAERRHVFETELSVKVTADNHAVARYADVLLIAVKPQVLASVCRPLHEDLAQEALVISIAAGVKLATLEGLFGANRAIVRVMPSILHEVSSGVAGLCGNSAVSAADLEFVLDLFRAIGVAESLSEGLLDAVTGLGGSGPAFVFVFLEALSDGGVAMGLPREVATRFAAQTVLGAAYWVLQGERPGALKELVTSPAGTTIAGLRAAEARGLRSAVMEAVIAAAQRSEELGNTTA
ncbi:MAG: pyrroline-5-carboxylate reductase [Candidatus Zipacnadales bacterium]